MMPISRLITAAVRLEELRINQDGVQMLLSPGPEGDAVPLKQLVLETRLGQYERSTVDQLLRDYEGALPLNDWWNEPLAPKIPFETHTAHSTSDLLKQGVDHLLHDQRTRQSLRNESFR